MAAPNPRRILCAATGCVKSAVIPRNRSKPNGWGWAEYLVNREDGRWVIPVEPLPAQAVLLCPRCVARQDAQRRLLASNRAAEAQRAALAAREAQEAAQAAEKASAQAAEVARRAAQAPEGYTSWAPEVIADSSGQWCGNALRFATRGEAEDNVRDLSWRWTLVRETRVVPSKDPVNYTYGPEGLKPV